MLVHHDMGYNIACARDQVGISINREPFDSQMHNKLLSEIRLELPTIPPKKNATFMCCDMADNRLTCSGENQFYLGQSDMHQIHNSEACAQLKRA